MNCVFTPSAERGLDAVVKLRHTVSLPQINDGRRPIEEAATAAHTQARHTRAGGYVFPPGLGSNPSPVSPKSSFVKHRHTASVGERLAARTRLLSVLGERIQEADEVDAGAAEERPSPRRGARRGWVQDSTNPLNQAADTNDSKVSSACAGDPIHSCIPNPEPVCTASGTPIFPPSESAVLVDERMATERSTSADQTVLNQGKPPRVTIVSTAPVAIHGRRTLDSPSGSVDSPFSLSVQEETPAGQDILASKQFATSCRTVPSFGGEADTDSEEPEETVLTLNLRRSIHYDTFDRDVSWIADPVPGSEVPFYDDDDDYVTSGSSYDTESSPPPSWLTLDSEQSAVALHPSFEPHSIFTSHEPSPRRTTLPTISTRGESGFVGKLNIVTTHPQKGLNSKIDSDNSPREIVGSRRLTTFHSPKSNGAKEPALAEDEYWRFPIHEFGGGERGFTEEDYYSGDEVHDNYGDEVREDGFDLQPHTDRSPTALPFSTPSGSMRTGVTHVVQSDDETTVRFSTITETVPHKSTDINPRAIFVAMGGGTVPGGKDPLGFPVRRRDRFRLRSVIKTIYSRILAIMSGAGGFIPEDTPRTVDTYDLDEIRSRLPGDLTVHITRDGEFPVAAGGCADIYRGTFCVSRMVIKVAIKAIKVYSAENNYSKKTKRLRREIKVWMKLNHTNVLPLFGTTSGFGPFPAMVCPWLDNGTLTSYLECWNGGLEILQVLSLIHDVASGLQYLHSQTIVHGDLSGSNVLIEVDGRACIADFGLSTVLDEIGGSTFATSSTGRPRGTLRWAAPELLDLVDYEDEKTPHTGPATESDIYSFGGIMLQILSGKVPYCYYSRDVQIVAAIFRGETPVRPDDPRVTDRRWRFIRRCWSPFRIAMQRPSSEEIVAFSRDDLVGNLPRAV